jgi:hypothetical protein
MDYVTVGRSQLEHREAAYQSGEPKLMSAD